jgi:hypothetical protein
MKINSTEVKSDNKLLATIDVEEFESIQESVDFYNTKLEGTDDAGKGAEQVLGLINAQHKARVTNAVRVEKTREVNPITSLKQKIKADPAARARLQALLSEFGISGELNVA